jgi:hypothetical protein
VNYQLNEGSIVVADTLTDRTMHVLAPKPGGTDFTVMISHDELEPEEAYLDFIDRQLNDLARQVNKFQQGPRGKAVLGAPKTGIEGVLLSIHYKQQGKFVYHQQAVFPFPDERHLLTFTASLPMPFAEQHLKQFHQMLSSFTPRR